MSSNINKPAITLHANISEEVASGTSFDVLVGEPSRRLIIMSGIARPLININDDGNIYSNTVIVKLGINVSAIHDSTTQIGLANIANGESAFVLAVDTGALERDLSTSELQLRVETSVLGEKTNLSGFSYQIVADVSKVAARISGTISVPQKLLPLRNASHSDLVPLFRVTANRIEIIPGEIDPIAGPQFSETRIIPVATGELGSVTCTTDECFVSYVIDGCPFNTELTVLVQLGSKLSGAVNRQVAGAIPVVLTNVEPEADGVNFAVTLPGEK